MPFGQAILMHEIPTSIGKLTLHFNALSMNDLLTASITPGAKSSFSVEVLDQSGSVMNTINGDLVSVLSPAELTQVNTFMNNMRTKAYNNIISGSGA